jgi:hypothetical protein
LASLQPYDRIEAGTDAHGLQITADADENINVSWIENDQPKAFCLNPDRSQITECQAVRRELP